MNALNGVWSDIYILLIIIQQELEKLTKILQENFILKAKHFQLKSEIFTKLKKFALSAFVYQHLSLIGEEGKTRYAFIKDYYIHV